MLRKLMRVSLVLTVCLVAMPLARGQGEKNESKKDAKPVVAVFTFDGPILEKPRGEELPLFAAIKRPALKDIVERMNKAKDDKDVKAVVLLLDEVDLGLAQIEELREAMDAIKAAGKEIYVHVDSLMVMRTLALAAGASRISVTPTAVIMITGFNAESPYVRGLLDLIAVKPDFLHCGEYKSAGRSSCAKAPALKPRG